MYAVSVNLSAPPESPARQMFSPSTLVTFMWAVYSLRSGPVNLQSNSTPTSASTPDGQVTSFGLKPVWRETTSTTDFAAPSALIVAPHPLDALESATASRGRASRDTIPGMGYPASVPTRPTKPSMSGPDLATLGLCFIAFFFGGVGYAVAVGA